VSLRILLPNPPPAFAFMGWVGNQNAPLAVFLRDIFFFFAFSLCLRDLPDLPFIGLD
jgi:uncharacterized membrane protein YccC